MTKLIIGVVLLIIANILIEEIKENIKRKEENIKRILFVDVHFVANI
ncbi:hypothetical protein [Clostridium botulinum]|nr:hypothetical protein [Clostridium botulinum]